MTPSSDIHVGFPIPLGRSARAIAASASHLHEDEAKAEQVYRNVLAVLATSEYLRCLGFRPNWEASDSHDSVMQSCLDIADLEVDDCGKLECRAFVKGEETVVIPAEVWSGRSGYVAVELDFSTQSATIIGFLPRVRQSHVPRDRWRSLEEFPDFLCQANRVTKLKQWLDRLASAAWKPLETFTAIEVNSSLAWGARSATSPSTAVRAKELDLQTCTILLVMSVECDADEVRVEARIYPVGAPVLPEAIALVLHEEGDELARVRSLHSNDFIRLPQFTCAENEQFDIAIELGDVYHAETFQI